MLHSPLTRCYPLIRYKKGRTTRPSAAIKCKKLMPHGEIISIKQTAWFIAITHQCQCAAWLLTVSVGCMLRAFRALQLACMGKTWLHQAWFSPTLVSTSSVFKSLNVCCILVVIGRFAPTRRPTALKILHTNVLQPYCWGHSAGATILVCLQAMYYFSW